MKTKQPRQLTVEEARRRIAEEDARVEQACAAEVAEVLKKHGCTLAVSPPQVTITRGK